MINLVQLRERGWLTVPNIASKAALLRLAETIGQPLPHPNGQMVRELVPMKRDAAPKNTMSAACGLNAFPWHTDTAFWSTPARHLVMRVVGDLRRETLVVPFSLAVEALDEAATNLIDESVWLIRTHAATFYCSIRFIINGITGWRYDTNCMRPVNAAARILDEQLQRILRSLPGEPIPWRTDEALVLSNWEFLHRRSCRPPSEGKRVLQRVYVR
jgi:alpha-ketoglutarate-dependent taurine dioxygenase